MSISIYDGTTPKLVDTPFVNVNDEWKLCDVHTNVGGTWKPVQQRITIPAGLIMLSQDGSVPTGWTRFTAADNKYIIGAGSTYSVNTTGGSSSINPSDATSSTSGAHSPTIHPYGLYADGGDVVLYWYEPPVTAGAHTHIIRFVSSYYPAKQKIVLIQADSNIAVFPAYSMGLAASTLSGFSVYSNSDGFLFSYTSNTQEALSVGGAASTTSGSHTHGSGYGYAWDYYTVLFGTGNSAHTHTLSKTATDNFAKCALKGVYKISNYAPVAGLIGLWGGASIPEYWALCDGTNGTLDLRDKAINVSSTGDGTLSSGTGQATINYTLDSTSWSHHHNSSDWAEGAGSSNKGLYTATYAHSHTASQTFNYTPPYYALYFIQYIG